MTTTALAVLTADARRLSDLSLRVMQLDEELFAELTEIQDQMLDILEAASETEAPESAL
jgi:hypothetical protein